MKTRMFILLLLAAMVLPSISFFAVDAISRSVDGFSLLSPSEAHSRYVGACTTLRKWCCSLETRACPKDKKKDLCGIYFGDGGGCRVDGECFKCTAAGRYTICDDTEDNKECKTWGGNTPDCGTKNNRGCTNIDPMTNKETLNCRCKETVVQTNDPCPTKDCTGDACGN